MHMAVRGDAAQDLVTAASSELDVLSVGDHVVKKSGYPFPGTVVSVFTKLDGQTRYVVEADFAPGCLHIFSPSQLTVD